MNVRKVKVYLLTFIISFMLLLGFSYIRTVYIFPKDIMIIEGKEYVYDFNTPIKVDISTDEHSGLRLNGQELKDRFKVNLSSPVKLESNHIGSSNIKLKLFGKIPFKTVTVNTISQTKVIPCGDTVGVKIYTRGILVVGTSSVKGIDGKEHKPYNDSDIDKGDIIITANDKVLKNTQDLSKVVAESDGISIKLGIEREGNTINTNIVPVKTSNKQYKIGLWVRDSTSGIGTLTFYNPSTLTFGALGHGISDVDTETLLTVGKGEILESSILSVKKGEKGEPGELRGLFLNEELKKGEIFSNNECGIYGKLVSDDNLPNNALIPIGLKNEIKEGPAVILSNIDGRKVETFTVDIQKIIKQSRPNSKNMVIKITDQRLIDKTGGIVQGMSGSPIIQNGKLIGAVTHVFINDPTRGYGIFAESMYQNSNNIR